MSALLRWRAPQMARWAPLSVLGVGLFTLWVFTSDRRRGPWKRLLELLSYKRKANDISKEEIKRRTVKVLEELCFEFHSIFTEFAQMTLSVQKSIANKGLKGIMDHDQMVSMLMQQGFQDKLEEAEKMVLEKNNVTRDDLTSWTKQFASDDRVVVLTAGLKSMSSDAAAGQLPLLPGVELPEGLQKEKDALKILAAIQAEKIKLFDSVFNEFKPEDLSPTRKSEAGSVPPPLLNARLTEAAAEAEKKVLKDLNLPLPCYFHHAVALHSRSHSFVRQRAILDETHSDRVVALMRRALRGNQNPSAVVLHDRLERVSILPGSPYDFYVAGSNSVTHDVLKIMLRSAQEEEQAPSSSQSLTDDSRCAPLHFICLVPKSRGGISELDRFTGEITKRVGPDGGDKKDTTDKGILPKFENSSFLFMDYSDLQKCEEEVPDMPSETDLPCYLVFVNGKFETTQESVCERPGSVAYWFYLQSRFSSVEDAFEKLA